MKKNKIYNSIVIVILFFSIFVLSYILYYYGYNTNVLDITESFDSSKQKLWAMSFGGCGQNYYDALDRISNELKQIKVFDEIVLFTDKDLRNDKEFWNKHGNFIENNKRGCGFWTWKSYIISKTLKKMNNNDILLYADVGCEIVNNEDSYDRMKQLIDKCNKYNILYTKAGHDMKTYCKMDLFEYMGMINDKIMNSDQYQAGLLLIKKNVLTSDFIDEWYNISCNYHLIDNSPSILQNSPEFIEHRHDQSIFSLLLKSDKYNKSMDNNDNIIIDYYPILISRKKNG